MVPPQKSVAEMGLLTIADWEPLAGISRTAGKEHWKEPPPARAYKTVSSDKQLRP